VSDIQLRAQREPWGRRIQFLLSGNLEGGRHSVAEPIIMQVVDDQPRAIAPTFTLDGHAAQMLMDQLWDCGLRPSEGSGSAGALLATQKHLEDMRRMAFYNMGVDMKDKP
jgi:hypothetical protein